MSLSISRTGTRKRTLVGRAALLAGAAGIGAVALGASGGAHPHHNDGRDYSQRPMDHVVDRNATLLHRRVAILTGDGLHDGETLIPLAYLKNRGAHVTVIGLEPAMVKAYNSDMPVRIEKSVSDVSVEDFDALVLPGGRAPDRLREHEEIVEFARAFFETGRPVAAICHGPQILVTAGVLDGKHVTCFPDVEEEVTGAGAYFADDPVVRDGNLITSRIPDDIPAFCMAIEEALIEARTMRTPDTTTPATPRHQP